MVEMKKHVIVVALGALALAAVIAVVLAVSGVVTLPVPGRPTAAQPSVPELPMPYGMTAGEVDALIADLPVEITAEDAVLVLTARMAYRSLSAGEREKVTNLALLEAAEQALPHAGEKGSLTVIGVNSRVIFSGGAVYSSSRAEEPARQFTGESACRVTYYAEGSMRLPFIWIKTRYRTCALPDGGAFCCLNARCNSALLNSPAALFVNISLSFVRIGRFHCKFRRFCPY